MKMKSLFVAGLGLLSLSACSISDDANDIQRRKTEEIQSEAVRQVGTARVTRFTELKLANEAIEQRDREDLICYVYTQSAVTGRLNYIGRCIGYGIPYGVSTTNPIKVEHYSYGIVLPQPEPNMLYTDGVQTKATWVKMIDESTGKGHLVFFEPDTVISPIKLH